MILKKTFKNSIFAILSYSIIGLLTFALRKIFLISLNDIYLGYEGLFGNIIDAISISSLGLDIIIYYRLEQAYGKKDKKSAGELFNFYKSFYLINCLVVFLLSIAYFIILSNIGCYSSDIIIIFLLMLVSYYLQIFISIYRMLFIISQEDYIYVIVDFSGQLVSLAIRFFILFFFKNYYIYLFGSTAILAIELLVINIIARKKFIDLLRFKIKKNYYLYAKDKGIVFDVKNNIIQKASLILYGATDNILISIIFGITQVAQLSNYYMISGMFNVALMKLFDPFQAAIGKIVNSDNENKEQYFNTFNCLGFAIANVSVLFSLVFFNDIISFIYGNKYSVNIVFVLFFALNQYVTWNHKFLAYYRNLFGKYELDKWFILFGSILNIILSIILSISLGLPGIIIGTFVSHLSFWIGRTIVIFKIYINSGIYIYIKNQLLFFFMVLIEMWLLIYVSEKPTINLFFYFLKICICIVICFITIILGYIITNNLKPLIRTCKEIRNKNN